jgi:NAD(P)-dependent dehydrogenase (short-subunit alcohol dehydrogenase family)
LGVEEETAHGDQGATLTPYVGVPQDVADLVVFLASDKSRYITGQTFVIDGGMSAHVGSSGG